MPKAAANFSLAKSVGTAGKSALKLANRPNWKEIRPKFNVLSESLGNYDDDTDDGNDNNKERFTEQHNNSARVTHSSFWTKTFNATLENLGKLE